MRIAIPTKDRPGNVAFSVLSAAQNLEPGDELIIYDDGNRPAGSDYSFRFALDVAVQRGVNAEVRRGKPHGIRDARIKMLNDALGEGVLDFMMLDDDIVIEHFTLSRMLHTFDDHADAEYVVPVIALANNEAGVQGFGKTSLQDATHQQYVLGATGTERIRGGAWTCATWLRMDRFDVPGAIQRLAEGPPVVEDYALTAPMVGYVTFRAQVWHCMTPDQGARGWETMALEYLRSHMVKL